MPIDWKHIRALNGSKSEGFEEFCSQLAGQQPMPKGASFIRKGKPDAGIECYWTLPTNEEVAWQAKYFLSLGTSRWAQLDDSVKTALEKHPRLIRYYVCVPMDLPDARIPGRTTASQEWSNRVEKWKGWAADRGMSVEFVWWGSHEMLNKLTLPANAGRAQFWFEAAVLDSDWFNRRLQEAIAAAGPRYTPEVNVELPIMEDFDAFGRTSAWVRRLRNLASQISKVSRLASYDRDKLGAQRQAVENVLSQVDSAIATIREIAVEPASPISFGAALTRIGEAEAAIRSASNKLSESENLEDQKLSEAEDRSYRESPFRSSRLRLYGVERALSEAADTLQHTEMLAKSRLLLLSGTAGVGKTHVLCDLARKRLDASLPTILLMGQCFRSSPEPWTQALQQLDLARWTADDFVGALEAAAQASNARALVMIDALNEGAGRELWPDHLGAFLQRIARSPWIAVAISVRSNYEKLVLPDSVISSAARVTHDGFADHEFDASKTFFSHYGIELPSTPLLAAEYRSPLFLKSICVGLKEAGHTRLPRGFHGISQVFRLYTGAINDRLARSLDFDPKSQLVQEALKSFVAAFPFPQEQWLSRSKAMTLVNSLLPNQTFQKSLYQGLVGEGLLVENLARVDDENEGEYVYLGYERLADHLTAESILGRIKQTKGPQQSTENALTEDDTRLSPGVLESLFIQSPEMLQQELMDFAPSVLSHWQWRETYRQSLIWRDIKAFSDQTLNWLNGSLDRETDRIHAVEILLTLASVPGHPWNADFLDRQLRKRSMPDRDAWWTLKLHDLYSKKHSAIRRMIDWALSLKHSDVVEEESVRLVSLALAWLLSSSHRFLRDRATKAAANLLNGRETATADLVRSFATVDDLYIRERILAVAYGVAMRLSDPSRIRPLADAVLDTVFAKPPVVAHLLLRDYARGVIERLHALEPQTEDVLNRVRPPYRSKWPKVPSGATIEKLEQSLKADGNEAWGARRIVFSVLHDDFGRYVIGTNSRSTHWLSLRLDQPAWRTYSECLKDFQAGCGAEMSPLWDAYREAESKLLDVSAKRMFAEFRSLDMENRGSTTDLQQAIDEAKGVLSNAKKALLHGLSPERARELKSLWKLHGLPKAANPPPFDLHLIQRYVAKRVFELGWTTERFEYFDNYVIRHDGRNTAKAERIGKKYQWIAYHEICALIADNFQFRNSMGNAGVEYAYQGPWQDFFRDIDPSHSLISTRGDAASSQGWWAPQFEPDWGDKLDGLSWAEDSSDFPDPTKFLQKVDPEGNSWFAADLSFDRERPVPEGMDREVVEARKVWCHLRSFLVHNEDVEAFMNWAEGVDFYGQWMPRVSSSHRLFLGEYIWSPAWKTFDNPYYVNEGWVQPGHGCPVRIRTSSFEYHQGSSGFDCSVDSGFTLHLPDSEIVKAMQLTWIGVAANFGNRTGQVVAQDPSALENGPAALLLRRDLLEGLARTCGLSICWMILGERMAYLPRQMKRVGFTHYSGACAFMGDRLHGFLHLRGDRAEGDGRRPILSAKRF